MLEEHLNAPDKVVKFCGSERVEAARLPHR